MGFTETIALPTDFGEIECKYFYRSPGEFCLVLVKEPMGKIPFVRIHSSCIFSESFHSYDCDCARQLEAARREVATRGGVIVYLFQEGRGIGLEGKMRAIALERTHGFDTADAFRKLGFAPDPRAYDLAALALQELKVGPEITLATNNPKKIQEIEKHGFKVLEREQLQYETNPDIDNYLKLKQTALSHYEKD